MKTKLSKHDIGRVLRYARNTPERNRELTTAHLAQAAGLRNGSKTPSTWEALDLPGAIKVNEDLAFIHDEVANQQDAMAAEDAHVEREMQKLDAERSLGGH
jgi:hypothetical protein